jgi:cytochrome P450
VTAAGRVVYDPRHPEVIADPYPVYRRLRDEDPVHRSEILGGWVLTRYAHVREGLLDRRLSADRIGALAAGLAPDTRAALQELLGGLGRWAVFTDPPDHTRLRGLMNRAFTSRAVEGLAPVIHAIVDGLLDRAVPRGRMDVIADFAYPLPAAVIGHMLGVPVSDLGLIKQWSDELATFVGTALTTPDRRDRAQRGLVELSAYFRGLVREHRARPRDDVMSALIAAEERGDVLSEDELVATCVLLMFAGHETTTNLIGNGLLALLKHPGELEALQRGQRDPVAAVEELLRYDGPAQAVTRIATAEVEIEGRTIPRGARVVLVLNAANRDDRQFADPDRLDLARRDNRHVAFGHGIHFCLGAPLARLEAQIGLPRLLARVTELRLATDALAWSDALVLRGVRALPLAFEPLPSA